MLNLTVAKNTRSITKENSNSRRSTSTSMSDDLDQKGRKAGPIIFSQPSRRILKTMKVKILPLKANRRDERLRRRGRREGSGYWLDGER